MFKTYIKINKNRCLVVLKSWYYKPAKLPLVFSTGITIKAEDWDYQHQRCKTSKGHPTGRATNGLIEKYINEATNYIRERQALENRTPPHSEVKAFLKALKNNINGVRIDKNNEKTDLLKFSYSIYIIKLNTASLSKQYKNSFLNLHNNIKSYLSQHPHIQYEFSHINEAWLNDWINWNIIEKKASHNTLTGKIRRMKYILSEAKKARFLANEFWKGILKSGFQVADRVYLSQKELMQIYHADLSESPHLDSVRDLFLLEALNGGHRMGDMSRLDATNIEEVDGAKVIKLHTAKTDTLVYSPDGWFLSEFLEKYKNKFPPMKSAQVFNRQIKEVCKLAGLDKPTKLRKSVGGKNVYITKKKYKYVSQYTARYSFATNCFLSGVPLEVISRMMGHSNTRQTEKYIKAGALHAAVNAASNKYFKEKPKAG